MHQPQAMDALAFPHANLPWTMETQSLVYPARPRDRGAHQRGKSCRNCFVFKTFPT